MAVQLKKPPPGSRTRLIMEYDTGILQKPSGIYQISNYSFAKVLFLQFSSKNYYQGEGQFHNPHLARPRLKGNMDLRFLRTPQVSIRSQTGVIIKIEKLKKLPKKSKKTLATFFSKFNCFKLKFKSLPLLFPDFVFLLTGSFLWRCALEVWKLYFWSGYH